ncbi:MAG: MBL fold metallo-hydrolase [Thermoleophilia bacterium]|jgi:L-ascorbate metabolism protein UlaG (beta-lactamase superfamily)
MRLTYYGHSSFLVETRDGTRVILDPYVPGCYDGAVRYGAITDAADVAIASHTHPDHAGIDAIPGKPLVLVQPKTETIGDLRIKGVDVFHDGSHGSERGSNTIVILDDGDVRLVHLGDLGHLLTPDIVEQLGRVDILLIPVGGHFTIDHDEATEVVKALEPRIVVPMHYKTNRIDFPIAGVDPFLAGQGRVERKTSSTIEVTNGTLPKERSVIVLSPSL